MLSTKDTIHNGHYARKQLISKSRLISWSHNARFQTGLNFANYFKGKKILDYGCGDGTFLALLLDGVETPSEATGAEIHSKLVEDFKSRLCSKYSNLQFINTNELDNLEYAE